MDKIDKIEFYITATKICKTCNGSGEEEDEIKIDRCRSCGGRGKVDYKIELREAIDIILGDKLNEICERIGEIEKTQKPKREIVKIKLPDHLKTEAMREAITAFVEHRKKMRKPMTNYGIELLVKKIDKLSKGNERLAIKLVNHAIERGWMSVYMPQNFQDEDRGVVV